MKSVFFIPTNRNIDKCLSSYVKEIVFAKERFNTSIPILIVETNNSFLAENKKVIESIKKQYHEIEIIHLTIDKQIEYFKELFGEIDGKIFKVFTYTGVNFGTAMNKLGLFTVSLGAEAFHRRDSDTYLISDKFPEIETLFPIENELKYLGRTIKYFKEKNKMETPLLTDEEKKILVVGGNYFGEWNLDVKDFARDSFERIYHLYDLLGFEKGSIVDICNEAFQFNQEYKQEDKLTLVTSVNDGLNPDCGNVAVFKLFEYLPALPGINTYAADYFFFDTSTALGFPSLHQSRPVFHEYHSERFEYEKKLRYWYGMMKFSDYFYLYNNIYNKKIRDPYCNENALISSHIIRILSNEIRTFTVNNSFREDRIKRIADEVLSGFNDDYTRIANSLKPNISKYIMESNEDYMTHALLLDNWNKIICRAKEIDLKDYL